MWEKRHEKLLPPKDKLFSKLKIIKEYLMETANIHTECRVHWTGKKIEDFVYLYNMQDILP